ncbi:phosphoserine phosphatase SerB [Porphyrobacter sp. CACIAM 03H1]|uniref:phosphoserine phosphatase SerB n=1 Tax=Porphyrobacter sp. CACIAM 03H1 TaxID=2003315 RepID=UPI000B5AB1D3|nr:phosphoserine phosphatase SerB [Porphyrobacter sp. CACIAM 03H1]ASJ92585.1 phosphoserine phosphatase SerB [Porphyrobacter sp. CACIAM 03H1]
MLIARLIAETSECETRLDALSRALAGAGAPLAAAAMPAREDEVLELHIEDGDPAAVLAAIDATFTPPAMLVARDAIEVPALFVSDMDSTMIGQECIDELADYAGIKPQIAEITERAMQGELDFEAALRERVALLAGLDESAIHACLAERITATPGAKTLVATLAALGTRTVLVTGGFHHFADPVAEMLGFHRVVGNRLGVEGGKLTGGLVGPITDSAVKAAVLAEEASVLGEGVHSLATGDGANDIPMIEAATYGFAYRAKPKARAVANGRVDACDLTAVLTLLGVPRVEWREA